VLEELRDRTRGKGQVVLRERRGAGSWEEAGWVTFGFEERGGGGESVKAGSGIVGGWEERAVVVGRGEKSRVGVRIVETG
jgi:hypothetical protein